MGQSDTLYVNSSSMDFFSVAEREQFHHYLMENPDNTILYSCEAFNKQLFGLINDYRKSKNLNELSWSVRLDTLGKKVLYWLHYDSIMHHYSSMKQMKPYYDLMNAENIHYEHNQVNSLFDFSAHGVLHGWMKSPKHNKNLLEDVKVGSAGTMAKITLYDGSLMFQAFSVFECDYIVSDRELTEKVDSVNKALLKRPIIIARKKN